MSSKRPIQIPAEALDELRMLERADYSYRMEDLVALVNAAALRFLPLSVESDGRIKGEFTIRTLRHYQTLGCLDTPELVGRVAIYRYRHYLQALLIRKLLFEGFSSKQIKDFTTNRTNGSLLDLLMRDVEVAESSARRSKGIRVHREYAPNAEQWTELKLDSEIAIKIRGAHQALTESQYKALLKQALKAIQARLG
ncbi:MAG: MerR family transcriptional regulator [Verrucomicrobiota bacterium]